MKLLFESNVPTQPDLDNVISQYKALFDTADSAGVWMQNLNPLKASIHNCVEHMKQLNSEDSVTASRAENELRFRLVQLEDEIELIDRYIKKLTSIKEDAYEALNAGWGVVKPA